MMAVLTDMEEVVISLQLHNNSVSAAQVFSNKRGWEASKCRPQRQGSWPIPR
jgi:hypothetical protein